MPLSHGQNSALSSHLDALIAKKEALSQSINEEMKHFAVNEMALRQMKLKRLKINEEIEILSKVS